MAPGDNEDNDRLQTMFELWENTLLSGYVSNEASATICNELGQQSFRH
jgi:hypothetical protein